MVNGTLTLMEKMAPQTFIPCCNMIDSGITVDGTVPMKADSAPNFDFVTSGSDALDSDNDHDAASSSASCADSSVALPFPEALLGKPKREVIHPSPCPIPSSTGMEEIGSQIFNTTSRNAAYDPDMPQKIDIQSLLARLWEPEAAAADAQDDAPQKIDNRSLLARLRETEAATADAHGVLPYEVPAMALPTLDRELQGVRTPLNVRAAPFVLAGGTAAPDDGATILSLKQWGRISPSPWAHSCHEEELQGEQDQHLMSEVDANARENTSVLIRNVPYMWTRQRLLDKIDRKGFRGLYDFVYLPIDLETNQSIGYAFVNFVDHTSMMRFYNALHGAKVQTSFRKRFQICYSTTQGLDKHISRYRNSPIMGESVPEEYKPALFNSGYRVMFPNPTKAVGQVHPRSKPQDLRVELEV